LSCSVKGRTAYLGIETDISCPTACRLQPGESAPHEVRLTNRGPLDAVIAIGATCAGPLLQYANGSPSWSHELRLPKRRRKGERKAQKLIQLPAGSMPGTLGESEDIEVAITRARGKNPAENPVILTLELELRP
jgi:hypothetical protein